VQNNPGKTFPVPLGIFLNSTIVGDQGNKLYKNNENTDSLWQSDDNIPTATPFLNKSMGNAKGYGMFSSYLPPCRSVELLLALASTVIVGFESRRDL
jgi:hypothetical protein